MWVQFAVKVSRLISNPTPCLPTVSCGTKAVSCIVAKSDVSGDFSHYLISYPKESHNLFNHNVRTAKNDTVEDKANEISRDVGRRHCLQTRVVWGFDALESDKRVRMFKSDTVG